MACKLHDDSYSMMLVKRIGEKLDVELKNRDVDSYFALADKLALHSTALDGQLNDILSDETQVDIKLVKESIKKICVDLGKTCLEILLKVSKETGEIK